MKKASVFVAGLALMLVPVIASAQNVVINEIMISTAGTDFMEFVELCGAPGTDLSNLTVLVIEGDVTSATGTIDRAWSLAGESIPLDGYFVLGNSGVANLDLDNGYTSNAIENGSGVVLLVDGFTGSQGDDIDTDDDGAEDVTPFSSVLDGVGRNDGGAGDLFGYYGVTEGPMDGSFSAAGLARCSDCSGPLTQLLCFGVDNCDLPNDGYANITPGAANECPSTGTEDASWGSVKGLFR